MPYGHWRNKAYYEACVLDLWCVCDIVRILTSLNLQVVSLCLSSNTYLKMSSLASILLRELRRFSTSHYTSTAHHSTTVTQTPSHRYENKSCMTFPKNEYLHVPLVLTAYKRSRRYLEGSAAQ